MEVVLTVLALTCPGGGPEATSANSLWPCTSPRALWKKGRMYIGGQSLAHTPGVQHTVCFQTADIRA